MNARALAGMYRAIVHDRPSAASPLDAEDLAQMGAVQSAAAQDAVLSAPGPLDARVPQGGSTPRGVEPAVRVSLSEDGLRPHRLRRVDRLRRPGLRPVASPT